MTDLACWICLISAILVAACITPLLFLGRRQQRQLLQEMMSGAPSDACRDFLRQCEPNIDRDIARRTFVGVRDTVGSKAAILPGSRLAEDFGIVEEDVDDVIALILRSLDRTWLDHRGVMISSVADLIRYVKRCPQELPAAADHR